MIGFFTSNAPALMAPWGGSEALIGNSPFAYAFPTGGAPVIVDMACSAAARGRIRLAASAGRPIPRGWALDVDGNATEDAAAAMQGLVLPMAEHKGSGLALAYELFSAVLPGATLSKDVPRDFLRDGADTLDSWGVGHFALAIDIEATRSPAAFAAQADELVDAVHAVPPRRGFERCPDAGRARARQRRPLRRRRHPAGCRDLRRARGAGRRARARPPARTRPGGDPPVIVKLHHVAILSSDVDALAARLQETLGLPAAPPARAVSSDRVELRTTMLPVGNGTYLQLFEPHRGPGVAELQAGGDGALYEVAFQVDDARAAGDAHARARPAAARPGRRAAGREPRRRRVGDAASCTSRGT